MRVVNTLFSGARLRCLFACGFLLVGFMPTAQALYKAVSFREMVSTADLIAIGTVTDKTVRWGEQGKMVFTDVQLSDIERIFDNGAYSNQQSDSLVVTLAGGELDGVGFAVSDTPDFKLGQRVLLYLNQYEGPVVTPIVGGMQGLYRIIHDDVSGQEYPLTWIGNGIRAVDQNG